jgi:uncharacterized protein involved in exopolysaccharide biosynthesis
MQKPKPPPVEKPAPKPSAKSAAKKGKQPLTSTEVVEDDVLDDPTLEKLRQQRYAILRPSIVMKKLFIPHSAALFAHHSVSSP